jgi:hypothetical protein
MFHSVKIINAYQIEGIQLRENDMIEVLSESERNILILRAVGKLTDQDYKNVLSPRLESIIRKQGKARLLLDMGDEFHGWEGAAMWDDFRFGMAHRNDFEKVGVIGGPRWVAWCMKLGALLMSGEVRNFAASERDEAFTWIKA